MKSRKVILSLVAVFTLLQLVVLIMFGYTSYDDSDAYIKIAEECILYGEPYPIRELITEIPFLWNIGAINAVTASLALFGSVMPLLMVYSLMKGMTALLFYSISKKILGHKTAVVCLLLYILYPANYGEGTTTLSELPFMFFIMLGMWLALVRNCYFWGGMFLSFANWFRPMGGVFLIAVIIILLYQWLKSEFSFWNRGGKLLLGYVLMICVIGFSTMHRTGLFLYQAKTGWMNLATFSTNNSPEAMAVRDNESWNVSQKDSAWCSIFMQWLKEHPDEYISQMPRKIAETYVSDNVNMCVFAADKRYTSVSLRTLIDKFPAFSPVQWFTSFNLLFYYLLLLTALASLRYFNLKRYLLPTACILIGNLLLLLVGFQGDARFHQPYMPFIIMLSSLFLIARTDKAAV